MLSSEARRGEGRARIRSRGNKDTKADEHAGTDVSVEQSPTCSHSTRNKTRMISDGFLAHFSQDAAVVIARLFCSL
jgi:hypothetical protein